MSPLVIIPVLLGLFLGAFFFFILEKDGYNRHKKIFLWEQKVRKQNPYRQIEVPLGEILYSISKMDLDDLQCVQDAITTKRFNK